MSQDETTRVVNGEADEAAEPAQPDTLPEELAAAAPAASETTEWQKKAEDYLAGWQRERAEFANYKRRVERDLKDNYQNASFDAFKALLPVIDDFERAMSNLPDDLKEHPWLGGVSLIQRKVQKLLDDFGIEAIDPVGLPFDPTRHEAVGMEASDTVESGAVTVTLQKGYVHGDRVLRPALVRVAS